jgi:hypothetical protein
MTTSTTHSDVNETYTHDVVGVGVYASSSSCVSSELSFVSSA